MNQIFVTCAQNDAKCAKQICNDLQSQGYIIRCITPDLDQTSQVSRQEAEIGILGSIGVVAVWSTSAQQSEVVRQNLLFAQRLKKRILLVTLHEKIGLPKELTHASFIISPSPCTGVVRLLLQHLPLVESQDPLHPARQDPMDRLYEQVAVECEHGGVSNETIQEAARMLLTEKYRDESLALLEYLAQEGLREGIHEEAKKILKNGVPSIEQSQHFFVATCPKNNRHHTTFDKRIVCASNSNVLRKHEAIQKANTEIDSLILHCGICGAEMTIPILCKGYR